jgi:two-component system chemotaxis response regulator CheB
MSVSPLRVLVVDDSRIFRAAIAQALASCPDVKVVGSVYSGEQALDFCRRSPPDLITLDLHRPGLTGLETLRSLGEGKPRSPPAPQTGPQSRTAEADHASRRMPPTPRPASAALPPILPNPPAGPPPLNSPGVLVVSTLTRAGAEITLQALQAGAFDFIHKPEGPDPVANGRALRRQLLEKISVFRASRRYATPTPSGSHSSASLSSISIPTGSLSSSSLSSVSLTPHTRPPEVRASGATPSAGTAEGTSRFRAVVIGASTGGPAVLAQLLPQIAQHSPVPVFVVTHLLAGFSEFLAESLARRCPEAQVAEAGEGVSAGPRQVFLAPSGRHLRLRTVGDRLCTALDDSPPELGFRPAVDVLFRSAAQTLRDRVLAVVLTGMDRDGTQGALAIRAAGGHVVVQDEASSVVWGMPGSVVAAGAAHEIVPLAQLGRTLRRHLGIPSPAAPPAGAR